MRDQEEFELPSVGSLDDRNDRKDANELCFLIVRRAFVGANNG
jgi:hypothetical protein